MRARQRSSSASARRADSPVLVVTEEDVGVHAIGQEGLQAASPAIEVGVGVARAAQTQVDEATDAPQVGLSRLSSQSDATSATPWSSSCRWTSSAAQLGWGRASARGIPAGTAASSLARASSSRSWRARRTQRGRRRAGHRRRPARRPARASTRPLHPPTRRRQVALRCALGQKRKCSGRLAQPPRHRLGGRPPVEGVVELHRRQPRRVRGQQLAAGLARAM